MPLNLLAENVKILLVFKGVGFDPQNALFLSFAKFFDERERGGGVFDPLETPL